MVLVALAAIDGNRTFLRTQQQPALVAPHLGAIKYPHQIPTSGAANAIGPVFDRADANSTALWIDQREKRICNDLQHSQWEREELTFFVKLAALDQLLALDTVACPWNGLQPLGIDVLLAVLARTVFFVLDPEQGLIN